MVASLKPQPVVTEARVAMNISRVLFPTDFSNCNDEAFKYATTFAAESRAKLFIVHVEEPNEFGMTMAEPGFLYPSEWETENERAARDQLSKIVPNVDVKFEHRFLKGRPAAEILRFAKREHVDLIVMGSHGRTGLQRLLMGSIAEEVMRKASCPVLVVKQPASEAAAAEKSELHVSQ
jgi:universal stress protein A